MAHAEHNMIRNHDNHRNLKETIDSYYNVAIIVSVFYFKYKLNKIILIYIV